MNQYYEKHGVLLAPSKEWQIRHYGFPPEAMGDCISHTLQTENPKYLKICEKLLKERKRWPDVLQKEHKKYIAKNRIQYWWSHILYELSKDENGKTKRLEKYGPQSRWSRDPFTFYYQVCALHGETKLIRDLKTPPSINRLKFWLWRKALLTEGNSWMRKVYIKMELSKLKRPMRVFVFKMVKARASVIYSMRLSLAVANYDKLKPNKGYENEPLPSTTG